MTLGNALSAYAALNAALAVGVLSLAALESFSRHVSARQLLSMNYWVAAGILASALACSLLPAPAFFEPSARIWSSQEFREFVAPGELAGAAHLNVGTTNLDAGSVSRVWIAAALALLALGITGLMRDCAALRRIRRGSHCVRQLGRVSIWLNDSVTAPFSYWFAGQAHVVLPVYLLERPRDFRMVVAHELQHHRQRDTVWLYFFRVLGWLFPLNPFAYLWNRRLGRMQEFACDEAMITHRGWRIEDYARCLLEVATRAQYAGAANRCATPFIRFGDPHVLTRRIEMMMQPRKWSPMRSLQIGAITGLVALMTASAYAASGLVQDRRVTQEQAEEMAARVSAKGGFAVVVNDEVLFELNRYAGTPQGREFMRAALQRFEAHRSEVSATLTQYGVPVELAAMPLIESGYQNLDASHNRMSSAGIWQFIPQTARVFGLRVDGQTDQRLDSARLTDAAARMLRADQLRFADWQLAVLAFNMGANGVQQAIDSSGSRDAWTLIRAGHQGDNGYLARVHAAVLLAANPQAVAP